LLGDGKFVAAAHLVFIVAAVCQPEESGEAFPGFGYQAGGAIGEALGD
jgi:hypothetical protein